MRYLNINLLWALPATMAIAVFWVVSAYANYEFGLSLGSDLFGYASLASDVAKTVILFGVFAAIAARRYLVSLVLGAIWCFCTIWSVASAVGFMSIHYSATTDQRGKNAESYTLLQNQIKGLEADLQKVKTVRPEKVVQAEIDALLQTPGAGGCSSINGPVSQSVCPKVAQLKIELGYAQSSAWLQGRLREARAELNASDRVTTIDPRADTLAAISGMSVKDTQRGFTAFFALMLELITAAGLWAIWSAFGGASPQRPTVASGAAKAFAPISVASAPVQPVLAPRSPMVALEKMTGVKAVGTKSVDLAPKQPSVTNSGTDNADLATDLPAAPEVRPAEHSEKFASPNIEPDGPGTPIAKPEAPKVEELTEDPKIVRPAVWHEESAPPVAPRTNGKRQRNHLNRKDQTVIQWLADGCSITDDETVFATGRQCFASYSSYCDGKRIPEKDRVPQKRMSTVLSGQLGTRIDGRGKRNGNGAVFPGLMINPIVAQIRRRVA